jgi:hypothetical protein
MCVQVLEPQQLVGTWRRFGRTGPAYEVLSSAEGAMNGDRMMRVRVVESGEELDYSLNQILDDPKER